MQAHPGTAGSLCRLPVAGETPPSKPEPERPAPLRSGERRVSVPEAMPAVAADDGAPGSPCWVRVTPGDCSPTHSRSKRRRLSEDVIRHRLAAVAAPEHKAGVKGELEAVAEETLDESTDDRNASPAPGQQEAPWDYKVGHFDWEALKDEPVDCLTCQDQGQRWRGKRVTYYEDHVPQQHPGSRRRPCEVGGAQYL